MKKSGFGWRPWFPGPKEAAVENLARGQALVQIMLTGTFTARWQGRGAEKAGIDRPSGREGFEPSEF